MLKFNSFFITSFRSPKYLNTSYVKVQYKKKEKKLWQEINLNTSYVKVQLDLEQQMEIFRNNLNTSYVKVQLLSFIFSSFFVNI